jgi:gluconolactonase
LIENRTIATGLAGAEGPAVGPAGWILNVCTTTRPDQRLPTRGGDIIATQIHHPHLSYRLLNTSTETVTGIPAALAFGPDNCLYITDEGHGAILRVDANLGITRLVDAFEQEPINGPNDLAFDVDGNLFFTDPWGSSATHLIGAVYCYRRQSGALIRLDTGMAFPNGIVVDGDTVYAAETFTRTVWRYRLSTAGTVTSRDDYCTLPAVRGVETHGPDGMAMDRHGHLYIAHYGSGAVYVYGTAGRLEEILRVAGERPTNLCFGGTDNDRLYITIDDAGQLVEYDIAVSGKRLPFCPSDAVDHPFTQLLASLGPASAIPQE